MRVTDDAMISAERIRVSGIVQGVGFRPFVWRLAQQYHLRGQVWNDAEGVMIEVWGFAAALNEFKQCLQQQAPPLAKITGIDTLPGKFEAIPDSFKIIGSQNGRTLTDVAPDAAVCPECLAEIRDPDNRRYRYPFTNCTHCGPRLSIIKAIPYDRVNTSMQSFTMCPECQAEYDDPLDRRFHAQPNACKTCGPSLWIENNLGERLEVNQDTDEIAYAAKLIQQGNIVAIKGIGGFHLACDATNSHAVSELRRRKRRYDKPFALMARNIDVIQRYAHVSYEEQHLLQDTVAPIVILSMQPDCDLPAAVAPRQNSLGFMLPYTPLHVLLLQDLDFPLVMTSGNKTDEAQCIDNDHARSQLGGIADYFVMHDRDIINRLDDSVARVVYRQPYKQPHNPPLQQLQLLRRGRGYAPASLTLPQGFENSPPILAMGAELKNTFCLGKAGKAFLSQHQGDLEDAAVFADYRDNTVLYQKLYQHRAQHIAIDCHPEYLSSKLGRQLAVAGNININKVQHHHAHIAACMAEHGLPMDTSPVLGIALDGLGYGDDGQLWGGEFLLANYSGYQRLASLQSIAMLGGFKAVHEPWRNTFAHLHQTLGWEWVVEHYPHNPFVRFMQDKPVNNLLTMLDKHLNSPAASSAGRLFDAVAAILGVNREAVSFEGQAAMRLEVMAEKTVKQSDPYPFTVDYDNENKLWKVRWPEFWRALLDDMAAGITIEMIAGRFHRTMISACADVVKRLLNEYGFNQVILSGGVMQNRILLEGLIAELNHPPLSVLTPRQYPANDGGIALGQAVVTGAQILNGEWRGY